jgi:uncharacterized protein (DUF2252 family)
VRTKLHVVGRGVRPVAPTASRSRKELAEAGRALRAQVPRRSHAGWKPPAHRGEPVELLLEATKSLVPELLPIRFGRMLHTPFTFFRGAASIMAADLARTPATGVRVQVCGDCHLLNFGGFATPERRLIFDINDFDETLPGPWEWDVKRLAVSAVLAARDRRFGKATVRDASRAVVREYRRRMATYAAMPLLEAWYDSLDLRKLIAKTPDPEMLGFRRKRVRKALHHTAADVDYPKLVTDGRGGLRIKDNPPLVYHFDRSREPGFRAAIVRVIERYRESLPDERRVLFDRYEFVDVALKVVGIGSVGTLCGIVLLMAGGEDPLFLQIKEARASVLEPYAGRCRTPGHGQRVVVGQRIMQAASDIFLGWSMGDGDRHFYLRQLRDAKLKPMMEIFDAERLVKYTGTCGRALARAHARSGRAATIAGYLGNGPKFDDAIVDFALAYADQTERDHAALVAAVRAGRVAALVER